MVVTVHGFYMDSLDLQIAVGHDLRMVHKVKRPVAEIARQQIVLARGGVEVLQVPLAAPINDVLGLAVSSEEYSVWLVTRYGPVFGSPLLEEVQGKKAQVALDLGARSAKDGRLDKELGPYLERLRFLPRDGVEVPDLVSLAAWSLYEAMRRKPLELVLCKNCKRPWLTTPGGPKFCQRQAPGQSRDCRTLAKERRLAGDTKYRAYRREYKRVSEAARRGGAITALDFVHWRTDNGPAAWQPFDLWKSKRKKENDG